jgi:hypothetical protein
MMVRATRRADTDASDGMGAEGKAAKRTRPAKKREGYV